MSCKTRSPYIFLSVTGCWVGIFLLSQNFNWGQKALSTPQSKFSEPPPYWGFLETRSLAPTTTSAPLPQSQNESEQGSRASLGGRVSETIPSQPEAHGGNSRRILGEEVGEGGERMKNRERWKRGKGRLCFSTRPHSLHSKQLGQSKGDEPTKSQLYLKLEFSKLTRYDLKYSYEDILKLKVSDSLVSTDRRIDKQNVVCTDNITVSCPRKEWNYDHTTTWMNLEDIMLREISQTQKDKDGIIPLIWGT